MAATHLEGSAGYRSPQRKLVKFFEQSRDKWKAKCRVAKAGGKQLKKRSLFLAASKERWKSRAQALERELKAVKAEKHEVEEALAALKKKRGQFASSESARPRRV